MTEQVLDMEVGLVGYSRMIQAEKPGPMIVTLRVHVLNNWVLGIWVLVIVVQIFGRYTIWPLLFEVYRF